MSRKDKEFQDLTHSEISSLVYNTRNVKIQQIKPVRCSSDDDLIHSLVHHHDPTESRQHYELPDVNHNHPPPLDSKEVPKKDYSKIQKRLFSKLNSILQRRIDTADQAQEVTSILKKVRRQNSVDAIIEKHFEHHFLIPLISSCDFLIRFEFLVEETLSFVLPLIRQEQNRHLLMDDILSSGALLFSFSSVRHYSFNPNIRTLGVELLSSSIDFILEISRGDRSDSPLKKRKYADPSFVPHELVLHGGSTFLPTLLNLFLESHSEIGIRRVLKCVKFLLLRTTVQVAQSLASSNRFTLIRNCISVVKRCSVEAQIDAAIILTGLSACSLIVAEKLVELNGWDDVRTILANPSYDFQEMPSSWLEKSAKAMKLIYLKRDSAILVHTSSEPASSFQSDWDHEGFMGVTESPRSEGREQSLEDAPPRPPSSSALATLPSGYWLHKKRPKNMNSASNSTLPKCRDRLLNSPFGDPKKVMRIQQRRAREAKEAQLRARQQQQTKKKVTETLPSTMGRGREKLSAERSDLSLSDLPADFRKQAVVAERLFGSAFGDGDGMGRTECGDATDLSTIDQLSYEEKLTVMMLQIRNSGSTSSPSAPTSL